MFQPEDRVGRLTVIDVDIFLPPAPSQVKAGLKRGNRQAKVLCDCGTEKLVLMCDLVKGYIQSCGCLRREVAKRANITHGLTTAESATRLMYRRWSSIMGRCYNPGHTNYRNYGGRGITVAQEFHNPLTFTEWILENLGPCPEGHSLDRVDNNDGYRPGNLRWATAYQQVHNRRPRSEWTPKSTETSEKAA